MVVLSSCGFDHWIESVHYSQCPYAFDCVLRADIVEVCQLCKKTIYALYALWKKYSPSLLCGVDIKKGQNPSHLLNSIFLKFKHILTYKL